MASSGTPAARPTPTKAEIQAQCERLAEGEQFPAYADISRLWKRGEIVNVCRAALEAEGPLDTRELAQRVLRAKGLDQGDAVLRKSVAYRIVQALGLAAKRQTVAGNGKRKGVRVWQAQQPDETGPLIRLQNS